VKVFVTQPDFTCVIHHVQPTAITIRAPVGDGARCTNLMADVKVIQTALNRFDPLDGGPSPRLVPDGICGRHTKAAILHFQKKWKDDLLPNKPDGVIDVNGPSIKRLRKGPGRPAAPSAQLLRHRARVIEMLTAARAALTLAKSSLQNTDALGFGKAALASVERHFHVQANRDPVQQITRIEQMFLSMQTAVGHTPQGPALLVDEPPRFAHGAFMFAHSGGWRAHSPNDSFDGLPFDSIYLCPRSRTLKQEGFSYGLIHELSHFVSTDGVRITPTSTKIPNYTGTSPHTRLS
jgi:hypothetical protein